MGVTIGRPYIKAQEFKWFNRYHRFTSRVCPSCNHLRTMPENPKVESCGQCLAAYAYRRKWK